jgi:hypothetical protein
VAFGYRYRFDKCSNAKLAEMARLTASDIREDVPPRTQSQLANFLDEVALRLTPRRQA